MNDLKFAFRQLLKSPGFTAVTVLTLALGIGGNTAMFTVANTLLLKPLPWPDSHRVVSLWEGNQQKNVPQAPMAAAQFVDLRRDAKSFEALAAWNPAAVNLAGDGATPERQAGALVTEDFFKVIGIGPVVGAGFTTEYFQPGADGVTLISQAVWQQRFGGDTNIVGRTIVMNGRSRVVVGVMPAGFQSPAKAAFWVPKVFSTFELQDRDYKGQLVLGRLAPGVTLESAQAEMNTLFGGLRQQFADVLEGWTPLVHPALEDVVKPLRPALLVLLGAVGMVLLMACLNVANLLLARGAARQGELGVRAALGASRRTLALQSLRESLAIALPGGLLGLLFAYYLLAALLSIAPATLPRIDQVQLDFNALLFTAAVCIVTTLVAGLAPALHQAQADPLDALRAASSRSTSRVGWWRRALVVFQVGATVVVLVATGLLLRSFERLLQRDLGFEPANLLTVRLELPPVKYAAEHQRDQFAEEILSRLAATTGVEAAAASTYLPLQGWPQLIMRLEENPVVRPSDAAATGYTGVTPDYFRAMGMRLLSGRGFTANDREGSPPVCVVNQTFARTHFGERDPLGKRLEIGFSEPPNWIEIGGVVNDTQNAQLETQPQEQVFVPLRQQPQFLRGNPTISLVVRSRRPVEGLGEAIRQAVWAVDKDQPLHLLQPMTHVLENATSQRRFTVIVLSMFAALALALAAIGLYGVMSGYVSVRTREIGVRMVLGAQRMDVLRLVLRMGARTLRVGMTLGALAALAVGRLLQAQLFETKPLDALTWVGVAAMLIILGFAACLVPAGRAARLQPVEALRCE
jgi:putative ABC transport system permease protein